MYHLCSRQTDKKLSVSSKLIKFLKFVKNILYWKMFKFTLENVQIYVGKMIKFYGKKLFDNLD
jgi:hypothetical protein